MINSIIPLFLLLTANLSFGQTNEEILKRAEEAFENERYVNATPDFLHLLSLDPLSHDLNFKYGACLLYSSGKKSESLRYLNYGVGKQDADPRAHYFRGRALHLNFQFKEAEVEYKKYKNLRGKEDDRYPVERQIEMCENGQKLLSTFTDIIVANKKEISESSFFQIYTDSKTIGGTILVVDRYQTKLDKKMGHVPVVHYPPNADAIYYSSYGDDLSTGLDIYVRRKLPDGKYGDAQKLPGNVNTKYDEDFPFMHSSGRFLYFSSKGHNSMGGYDVFMSKLDQENYVFGTPENVDFAISSPNDDLFYVVDENFENAYFASSRQSEEGKLHVYKVKVVRVPVQDVIVMGDFISEVNPELKEISVSLTAQASGSTIGSIKSNNVGKYSYVFPKGGKYEYNISIEGAQNDYQFVVDLPFQDELKPLKQRIIHKIEDGQEIVVIENLFGEDVEGAEALIASVIRKKSELEVNENNYDLEEIEAQQKRDEKLEQLGLAGLKLNEIETRLDEIEKAALNNSEKKEMIVSNLDSEMLAKAERVEELLDIENELKQKADNATTPAQKHKLLKEANEKKEERLALVDAIKGIQSLKEETSAAINVNPEDVKKLQEVNNSFANLVAEGKEDEAINLLTNNVALLEDVQKGSYQDLLAGYTKEARDLRAQIKSEKDKELEWERTIEAMQQEINRLQGSIETAKKKDVPGIQAEIAQKQDELAMTKEYRDKQKSKIKDLYSQLNVVESQVASLENAIETDQMADVDPQQLEESIEAATNNNASQDENYEEQIAKLEEEHPELNPDAVQTDVVVSKEIESDLNNQIAAIDEQGLTEEETLIQQAKLFEETSTEIDTQLEKIDNQLENDPNNAQLKSERTKLQNLKTEIENSQKRVNEELAAIEESTQPAMSIEDVIADLDPKYESSLEKIENSSLSQKEKLTQEKELRSEMLQSVKEEIRSTEAALNGSDNSELEAKLELLKEIASTEQAKIDELNQQLDSITTEPIANKTNTDYYSSYDKNIEASMQEGNEEKKLNSLIENEQELQAALEKRKDRLEEGDPEVEQINALLEASSKRENDYQSELETLNETIANNTVVEAEDFVSNYTEEQASIEANDGLSAVEKQEKLNELDQQVLAKLNKEKTKVAKKVESNPTPELEAELASIKRLEESISSQIEERNQTIAALNETETNPNTNPEVQTEEALIAKIDPKYEEQRNELLSQTRTPSITIGLIELEQELQQKTKKELDNATDANEKAQLEKIIASSENRVKNYKTEDVNSMSEDEIASLVNQIDESYAKEIEALSDGSDIPAVIQREKELQAEIEMKLHDLQKKQDRKYSVSVDLEMMKYESIQKQSKQTSDGLEKSLAETEVEEDVVADIKTELGIHNTLMEVVPNDVNELQNADRELEIYENKLRVIRTEKQEQYEDNPTAKLESEIEAIDQEIEKVVEQRRRFTVRIGELETEVIQPELSQQEQEVHELTQKESELTAKLNDDNLSRSEQKAVKEELREVHAEKVEKENDLLVAKSEGQQQETQELMTRIESEEVKNAAENELNSISEKESVALATTDKEEQNYLLEQVNAERQELNDRIEERIVEDRINSVEEETNANILSREELEKRRRRAIVRIGELNTEIEQVNNDLRSAKKKEIAQLEEEKSNLIAQRDIEQKRLEQLDAKINQSEEVFTPVVRVEAMEQEMTFNEERKLAGTEEYKNYEEKATEALLIEEELRAVDVEIDNKRAAILGQSEDFSVSEDEIAIEARKLDDLIAKRDELTIKLTQAKYIAEQALPTNADDAMKMQNLVARGIKPIKTTVVAATLIAMPESGFAIGAERESTYSAANPIPVGVTHPSGLVYRVQVGAFARPIPQDLFKEFTPVSGEKIEGTNITRYMAGYFNSSDEVVNARGQIRELGYSDAFVVAYCDGERVQFGEARRMEADGTCVPKGKSEMIVEVAEKTAESMGIDTKALGEVQEVPELSYNDAPGAVEADAIDSLQGLFFTVQIGVFNRPVDEETVYNLPEIMTYRLPNGLIRYMSGMYNSVEEAYPRQVEARRSGVNGAFVTAYYKGERISLGAARKILAKEGPSVLQLNQQPKVEEENGTESNEVQEIVETVKPKVEDRDPVVTERIKPIEEVDVLSKRVQIVSKKSYDEYPREILNRYNSHGSYYFDSKDRKVKSIIYKNEDYLPQVYYFRDEIDTVYLEPGMLDDEKGKIIEVQFADSVVTGEVMDRLLRINYRRSLKTTEDGVVVRLYGVEEENIEAVLNEFRTLGVSPFVREETEFELELEEEK